MSLLSNWTAITLVQINIKNYVELAHDVFNKHEIYVGNRLPHNRETRIVESFRRPCLQLATNS